MDPDLIAEKYSVLSRRFASPTTNSYPTSIIPERQYITT